MEGHRPPRQGSDLEMNQAHGLRNAGVVVPEPGKAWENPDSVPNFTSCIHTTHLDTNFQQY